MLKLNFRTRGGTAVYESVERLLDGDLTACVTDLHCRFFDRVDDEENCGSCHLRCNGRGIWTLYSVLIDEDKQGRGLGTRFMIELLEACHRLARLGMMRELDLTVATTNLSARKVYEKVGFAYKDDSTIVKGSVAMRIEFKPVRVRRDRRLGVSV